MSFLRNFCVSIEQSKIPFTSLGLQLRPRHIRVPQSPLRKRNSRPGRSATGAMNVHPEVRGWNRLTGPDVSYRAVIRRSEERYEKQCPSPNTTTVPVHINEPQQVPAKSHRSSHNLPAIQRCEAQRSPTVAG